MSRSWHKARAGILLAVATVSCVTTSRYAVRIADTEPANSDSCYRQCQSTRTAGVDSYVGCVKACPGVDVRMEKCAAAETPPDSVCVDESHTAHNYAGTAVVSILLGAIVFGISYAALPDADDYE